MRTLVINYSKRLGALAIGWLERYKSDVLFRSGVSVGILLTVLAVISIVLFILLQEAMWYAFAGVVATEILFGLLIFQFMLLPTRNTLHYQKLFISNVAHELRTPLSVIKTSTEVALIDPTLLPSGAIKTFREIITELDRLSEIVNNLLSLNTLTRPEQMRFGNVDILPIVEAVAERHLPLAHERGIMIKTKHDDFGIVWGNATALEQIITNLLKNAIIYTQKNAGGVATVSVRPDYQGSIELSVADNGIGIAQKDLAHIFEPFYRADTSRVRSVRTTGSGLGLAIVNEIVRVHQGKIHIESARNQGTLVTVLLPMGTQHEIAPEIASPAQRNHVFVDFSEGSSKVQTPPATLGA
jgi:signal transduction histidine kinase